MLGEVKVLATFLVRRVTDGVTSCDAVEYESGLPYVFSDHSRTRLSPI
jgi:hypothetical protein